MKGSLALVGSGEYLPAMAAFEKTLLDDAIALGKAPTYIQIPTAAGAPEFPAETLSLPQDAPSQSQTSTGSSEVMG